MLKWRLIALLVILLIVSLFAWNWGNTPLESAFAGDPEGEVHVMRVIGAPTQEREIGGSRWGVLKIPEGVLYNGLQLDCDQGTPLEFNKTGSHELFDPIWEIEIDQCPLLAEGKWVDFQRVDTTQMTRFGCDITTCEWDISDIQSEGDGPSRVSVVRGQIRYYGDQDTISIYVWTNMQS